MIISFENMMSINLNLNGMGICQTYHLNLLFLKTTTFSVTLKMADWARFENFYDVWKISAQNHIRLQFPKTICCQLRTHNKQRLTTLSKESIFWKEAVAWGRSAKKASGMQLYLKRDSSTGILLWILGNFQKHIFIEHLPPLLLFKGL